MAEAAAELHEIFTAYIAAGFTEQQALYLIAHIVGAMAGKGK
jgi:hypothetical protein